MVFRGAALLFLAFGVQAAELEGVKLEQRILVDGQALELNGMALRTRMFFKVYVAGLYLPQRSSNARRAIEGNGAKRIVLVMMRDATAQQFCDSILDRMERNNTLAEMQGVRPQTEALFAKIRAVGEARSGMRIVLDYAPSLVATTLFIDGVPQGAPIPGEAFFRALLRVWLGDDPSQPELKRALLGVDQ
jgi:hypothetical protein